MLTLYRLLAIQIVERLHELFIETVGDTLSALGHTNGVQVPCESLPSSVENTAPRGKAGNRWRGRPSTAGSAVGGNSVPLEDVQCMWIAVRSLLQRAHLLVLEPGAQEVLQSSVVLLRGSLVATSSDTGAKRPKRLPCTAVAPCALVWATSRDSSIEGAVEVCAGAFATGSTWNVVCGGVWHDA